MDGDSNVNLEIKLHIDESLEQLPSVYGAPEHPPSATVQKLPATPGDFCTVCDPVFNDDLKLAVVSTVCCWLLLGILPVVIGIVGICYAIKAKKCKSEMKKEYYSTLSRSISWIGMLLFTVVIVATVLIVATCGVLKDII